MYPKWPRCGLLSTTRQSQARWTRLASRLPRCGFKKTLSDSYYRRRYACKMTENDSDLLVQFARDHSQDAFSELVNRHLNLVYAAALRQVRSPELAEEISLSVFNRLATHANNLPHDTIVTAWLYKVACNSAVDVIRREARRQDRKST